jgi:hypothetical protein
MEQILSWETDNSSDNHEIPYQIQNPRINYSVHLGPQLDTITSQLNPIHSITH